VHQFFPAPLCGCKVADADCQIETRVAQLPRAEFTCPAQPPAIVSRHPAQPRGEFTCPRHPRELWVDCSRKVQCRRRNAMLLDEWQFPSSGNSDPKALMAWG
jgi:hypothetical protein